MEASTSPEISSDVSSSSNHGGKRGKLTWQDKLALVDHDIVGHFIKSNQGSCECKGMQKIHALGEAGITMVHNLRDARMAGAGMGQGIHTLSLTTECLQLPWHIPFIPHVSTPRGRKKFPHPGVNTSDRKTMIVKTSLRTSCLFACVRRGIFRRVGMGVRAIKWVYYIHGTSPEAGIPLFFTSRGSRVSKMLDTLCGIPKCQQRASTWNRSPNSQRRKMHRRETSSTTRYKCHSLLQGFHARVYFPALAELSIRHH